MPEHRLSTLSYRPEYMAKNSPLLHQRKLKDCQSLATRRRLSVLLFSMCIPVIPHSSPLPIGFQPVYSL